MVEDAGNLTTLRTIFGLPFHFSMQNPDGDVAAAATQRQQQDQALETANQRDIAQSLGLLREAVLRLTQ